MKNLKKSLGNFEYYLNCAGLDKKPYQKEGVKWCLNNEMRADSPEGVKGGLVADEMGLGKTIMMMGLIYSNFKTRTLIVLPKALLDQWENEIMRTLGHQVLVYHGVNKKTISYKQLLSSPIVITTYGHISMDKDVECGTILHEIVWDRIIFDEAHHLRNRKTRTHIGALHLESPIKWLVTGTPIQNRKSDFYALCAIMGLSTEYYTRRKNLYEIVKHFLMKRTKKQVGIKLPPLKIRTIQVAWQHESERKLAEDIHSMLVFSQVSARQVDNSIALLSMDGLILPLLVRARQACIYPPLIKKQLEKYVEIGLLEDDKDLMEGSTYSSKIDAVMEKITERKSNGKNKLVFCHYRAEIDILAERCKSHQMSVHTFDGRTNQEKRNEILESNVDVLILQIQTGCEGLNLQQFSEIYFVSPHWNPAVEDQAIARCHRLGQTEEVAVFRFTMNPFDDENETITLDEYSRGVQEVKREVMDTFLEEEEEH